MSVYSIMADRGSGGERSASCSDHRTLDKMASWYLLEISSWVCSCLVHLMVCLEQCDQSMCQSVPATYPTGASCLFIAGLVQYSLFEATPAVGSVLPNVDMYMSYS